MILKKDTRPISLQVVSGLKISAAIVAFVAGLLLCLSFVPVRRIEAFVWHLRHGTSVEVGGYRFPAPKQWYVESFSPDDVLLVDLKSGDSIGVRLNDRSKRMTLAVWARLVGQTRGDNIKVTGRKELHIGNEVFVCFEKDFDLKKLHLYPIECRSEGALEVSFTPFFPPANNRNEAFYSLLQQTVLKR